MPSVSSEAGTPSRLFSIELKAPKFKPLVVVCADCEKRSDGPRHVDSKSVSKQLKSLSADSPVRCRITRTRCLGLCPHKALAVVALGDSLPAMSAEIVGEGDLQSLSRYAFGSGPSKP